MIMFCLAANVKNQFDKLKKKPKKYISSINVPVDIFQIIKLTFTGYNLSSDDLGTFYVLTRSKAEQKLGIECNYLDLLF